MFTVTSWIMLLIKYVKRTVVKKTFFSQLLKNFKTINMM